MQRMKMLKGITIIILGGVCWLALAPMIIAQGVNAEGCLSGIGWVGILICLSGVALVIYGIGSIIT